MHTRLIVLRFVTPRLGVRRFIENAIPPTFIRCDLLIAMYVRWTCISPLREKLERKVECEKNSENAFFPNYSPLFCARFQFHFSPTFLDSQTLGTWKIIWKHFKDIFWAACTKHTWLCNFIGLACVQSWLTPRMKDNFVHARLRSDRIIQWLVSST